MQFQWLFSDQPDISISGENEKNYGDTALFEANVEKVKSPSWSITWQKHRGNVIERIDTSTEKYRGSTKRRLVIKSVCKEDEGEYQAVLSFESNGPDYKSKNTIRLYVFGGKHQVATFLKNTYISLESINNEHLFAPRSTSGFTKCIKSFLTLHHTTQHQGAVYKKWC